jgi:hypothetical protein
MAAAPANQEQVNNKLPPLNDETDILEYVMNVDQSELEIG